MGSLRMRTLAGAGVLLLALAACGDGDDEAGTQTTSAATETEIGADPYGGRGGGDTDTGSTAPAETGVMVAGTSIGEVLTDSDGLTLYMFEPDQQGVSTCYDECAQVWPPLTVDGEPAASEGVDESLLAVAERDDGTSQVTYGQWPLYHFAQDSAAGDVNGQGVDGFNGLWWVVDPEGQPVRE